MPRDTIIQISRDTVVEISKDTVFVVKDNAEAFNQLLQNISSIASWLELIIGAIGILITIGIAYFGFKWFRDTAALEKYVDNRSIKLKSEIETTVQKTVSELSGELAKQMNSFKAEIDLKTESYAKEGKRQDLSILVRGIVTSEKKDLFALSQAIKLATELRDESTLLGMVHEIHNIATSNPIEAKSGFWRMMGVEKALESALEAYKDNGDVSTMLKDYINAVREVQKKK